MWGNWVVSSEWVVGVFGSNVGSHHCGYLSLWDIFHGHCFFFYWVFYFVLIAKKGQGLWASRNEWNNQ